MNTKKQTVRQDSDWISLQKHEDTIEWIFKKNVTTAEGTEAKITEPRAKLKKD